MGDVLKGEIPVGIAVKKQGFDDVKHSEIENDIKGRIRTTIGAVACYQETIIVDKLPKTRSGKILRRSLKEIYNTENIQNIPATIEEEDALHHFKDVLMEHRRRKSGK